MTEYVFKRTDNALELVGNFEGLYQAEVDPWQQSAAIPSPMSIYYQFSRARLALALASHGMSKCEGVEFGCGLGYSTATLAEVLNCKMVGIDKSPTAVQRAAVLHPICKFALGDLSSPAFSAMMQFDFGILGQMLWYVLPEIDTAIRNALSCIRLGGIFAVSQSFLRSKQLYGAEIADGFNGTLSLFLKRYPQRLQLIAAQYDDTGVLCHNDGLLIFRVK